MTIPQIQSVGLNLLTIAAGATAAALVTAVANHEVSGWGDLIPAISKYSFVGFVAALTQVAGWLGQSSPLKRQ